MAITWIEHNNKKILDIDLEKTTSTEKMIDTLIEAIDHIKGAGGKVLCLINFEGTFFKKELMDVLKSRTKDVAPLQEKVAMLGITGIKKVLMNIILTIAKGTKTRICNTREEALDWLAE